MSEADPIKELSPTVGTTSAPDDFGRVCRECEETLPHGTDQCAQHLQAWVYGIPIYHEPADPLRQEHQMLLKHLPTLSRVFHLQTWQLIHHARAIQLWISGFLSLTPKIRARKQPSVPLMSNQHVLLLLSTPGKQCCQASSMKIFGCSTTVW